MKKIAIHLFGHMRTYQKTHQKFFQNFINTNLSDANMDIFIHTWDEFQTQHSRHQERVYATMQNKRLDANDISNIRDIYSPTKIQIDTYDPKLGHGMYISVKRVNGIRRQYEKENNIKYDYYIYTRPDILFINPFKIKDYIDFYLDFHKDKLGIMEKITWCVNNYFRHLPFIDMRFVNEGDLCWINNFDCDTITPRFSNDFFVVPIRYICFKDFIILREISQDNIFDPFVETKQSILENAKKLPEAMQRINALTLELSKNKETIISLNKKIISLPIQEQTLKVENLKQDLAIKQLQTKKLEKELGISQNSLKELEALKAQIKSLECQNKNLIKWQSNPNLATANSATTAKSRIQSQLTYKIGRAMIENSKSIWGYIRMPYVLSYIKEQHQKEQKAYNDKIKADPSLKLPPIELYPDYQDALKEKECLTYKLGTALIEADKSPLKLGYLSLWFKCKAIQKEYKKT